MPRRIVIPLVQLALTLSLAGAVASSSRGQEDKVKGPVSKYALDILSRKAGEEEFDDKSTRRYGIEVYADGNNDNAFYLSETGSISAVAAKLFKAPTGGVKAPLSQHGLIVTARPAGVKEFAKGKRFGLEVDLDENDGALLYLSETGAVAAVPARYAERTTVRGKLKKPTWKHSMDLRVRRAGEKHFNKDTLKLGLEVYRDEHNGNLVYVSEKGGFAVVPEKLASRSDSKRDPDWKYGLELATRKAGENEVTKDTRRWGIEVFVDENTGNVVYICETGGLAVVPGKFGAVPEGRSKEPFLKYGLEPEVRRAGEKDFGKARKYGVEVYLDENTGNLVYITETGDLSVVSPKAE